MQCCSQRTLHRAITVFRGSTHSLRSFTVPTMTTGKLDSPQFKAILTPELTKLGSLFTSRGYGFRLVGGVVRDLLLGNTPKDIDIATDCTPDAMMEIFKENGVRYIPTGLQHGTITVHSETGVDYEVHMCLHQYLIPHTLSPFPHHYPRPTVYYRVIQCHSYAYKFFKYSLAKKCFSGAVITSITVVLCNCTTLFNRPINLMSGDHPSSGQNHRRTPCSG